MKTTPRCTCTTARVPIPLWNTKFVTLQNATIALMIEALRTSKRSATLYKTTWRNYCTILIALYSTQSEITVYYATWQDEATASNDNWRSRICSWVTPASRIMPNDTRTLARLSDETPALPPLNDCLTSVGQLPADWPTRHTVRWCCSHRLAQICAWAALP
jgi:hypothetical protein